MKLPIVKRYSIYTYIIAPARRFVKYLHHKKREPPRMGEIRGGFVLKLYEKWLEESIVNPLTEVLLFSLRQLLHFQRKFLRFHS